MAPSSAVLAGDTETHDRIVSKALAELAGKVDLVVLAQASMARVLQQMPAITIQVLSSAGAGGPTHARAAHGFRAQTGILIPVKKRHGVLALLAAVWRLRFWTGLRSRLPEQGCSTTYLLTPVNGDGC